jgi:hypothetical protein
LERGWWSSGGGGRPGKVGWGVREGEAGRKFPEGSYEIQEI